jgi:hypothetical protein
MEGNTVSVAFNFESNFVEYRADNIIRSSYFSFLLNCEHSLEVLWRDAGHILAEAGLASAMPQSAFDVVAYANRFWPALRLLLEGEWNHSTAVGGDINDPPVASLSRQIIAKYSTVVYSLKELRTDFGPGRVRVLYDPMGSWRVEFRDLVLNGEIQNGVQEEVGPTLKLVFDMGLVVSPPGNPLHKV